MNLRTCFWTEVFGSWGNWVWQVRVEDCGIESRRSSALPPIEAMLVALASDSCTLDSDVAMVLTLAAMLSFTETELDSCPQLTVKWHPQHHYVYRVLFDSSESDFASQLVLADMKDMTLRTQPPMAGGTMVLFGWDEDLPPSLLVTPYVLSGRSPPAILEQSFLAQEFGPASRMKTDNLNGLVYHFKKAPMAPVRPDALYSTILCLNNSGSAPHQDPEFRPGPWNRTVWSIVVEHLPSQYAAMKPVVSMFWPSRIITDHDLDAAMRLAAAMEQLAV